MATENGALVRNIHVRTDLLWLLDERPMDNASKFIGDRVLPPLRTTVTSGNYKDIGAGVGQKLMDTNRAKGGTFNETDYEFGEKSFRTAEHGIETRAEEVETMIMASFSDLELLASEISRDTLLINREKRVSDALFNTTVFTGADYTKTAGTKWNLTASTIVADIRFGADKIKSRLPIPQLALSAIMSEELLLDIIDVLALNDDLKYTMAIKTMPLAEQTSLVARYIRVSEIITGISVYDETGLNADVPSFKPMWDRTMCLLALISKPTAMPTGGLGRQPIWINYSDNFNVTSYFLPSITSTMFRASDYRGEYIDPRYGFLFTACI